MTKYLAHSPKVAGSNPAPATMKTLPIPLPSGMVVSLLFSPYKLNSASIVDTLALLSPAQW